MPATRTRPALSLGAALLVVAGGGGGATAAHAAPAPPSIADTNHLARGPYAAQAGRVAYVHGSTYSWRLLTFDPLRGRSTTQAVGVLDQVVEDEGGYSATEELGAVAAGGDTAVVETTGRVGDSKTQDYRYSSRVEAYSLSGGPMRLLASCEGNGWPNPDGSLPPFPKADVATDGATMAVSLCDRTRIFEPTGTEPVVTIPSELGRMAVAGPYLASIVGPDVVVRRWATGEEALRAPYVPGAKAVGFALQPDGALAIASIEDPTGGCEGNTLTWHAPGAPAAVTLPVAPCFREIQADGGKVVVKTRAASDPSGFVLTEVGPGSAPRDLAWLGFSGADDFAYAGGIATSGIQGCEPRGRLFQSSPSSAFGSGPSSTLPPFATDCPFLQIQSARHVGRDLRLRASIRPGMRSVVLFTFRVRGRDYRRVLKPGNGDLRRTIRLPRWAAGKHGEITMTYLGDRTFTRRVVRQTVDSAGARHSG